MASKTSATIAREIKLTNAKARSTSPAVVAIPEFPGRVWVAATAECDKSVSAAVAKRSDTIKAAFNGWLDAVRMTDLDKSEVGCNALKRAISENEAIAQARREGMWIGDATYANYVNGLLRAFYYGAEWTPRAFQAESAGGLPALPWSKKAGKAAASKPQGSKAVDDGEDTGTTGDEAKAAKLTGPADEIEARAFIRGQLNMLVAYGNKHLKLLDLQTRDVLAQLAKLAETVGKIDAARM